MSPSTDQLSVVQVDDGREWRGGQRQVLLLVQGLAARGVRQWLLAPKDSPLAERLRGQPNLTLVEYSGGLSKPLRHVLKSEPIDIVHAHRGSAHRKGLTLLRGMRRFKRLDPTPVFISTRRVDFAIKRNPISRRNYRDPHQHYIAISSGVKDVLIAGGVDAGRIDVVHSGIPPLEPALRIDREAMRAELGLASEDIAIGNVGALTDHKGQRYLIEAAPEVLRAFPRARFFIFGEGELEEELRSLIADLNLKDQVRLCGYVAEARTKLAAFDLYAHPSHLEGLGTAILDALLADLPVVAAKTGGVPDIVIDGETGLLAPPRDPHAFASRIMDLLKMPPDERKRLAANGRERAERLFSADAMVEGTLAVYRKQIDLRRR